MDVSRLSFSEKRLLAELLPEEKFEDATNLDKAPVVEPSKNTQTFQGMLEFLLSDAPYSLRGGKRQLARDLKTTEANLYSWLRGKSQPGSTSFLRVKTLYGRMGGK
jgi:hypothetical protein